jgi:transposase
MGARPSIDETSLSNGEPYALIANKAVKGRKGCLVAVIFSTKPNEINAVLEKIPEEALNRGEEITLDMSDSMCKIVRYSFPCAQRVIDRFHVQWSAFDTVREMHIAHRQDAINDETISKRILKNSQDYAV